MHHKFKKSTVHASGGLMLMSRKHHSKSRCDYLQDSETPAFENDKMQATQPVQAFSVKNLEVQDSRNASRTHQHSKLSEVLSASVA